MFLKRIEIIVIGFVLSYAVAHKAQAVAEVEAVLAAAPGSPAQANVNAAIDKVLPPFVRAIAAAELPAEEAALTAALAQGAPAFVDKVIAFLQGLQAKLAH